MPDYFQMIHPRIVHFPIALFITALGLEIISIIFRKDKLHATALHIYVVAALLTPLVIRTGLWEETRLHLNHPVLTTHRTFALWTMWISLGSLPILWFMKQELSKYNRAVFVIFLLIIVSLVSITAHNGGRMVYEYGVGVAN